MRVKSSHPEYGENPEKTGHSGPMGANAGTVETRIGPQDPDMQVIIDAWPRLPDPLKDAILAMVANVGQAGR